MFEVTDDAPSESVNVNKENLAFSNIFQSLKDTRKARENATSEARDLEYARTGREPSFKRLLLRYSEVNTLFYEYKNLLAEVTSNHSTRYFLALVNTEIMTKGDDLAEIEKHKEQINADISENNRESFSIRHDKTYQSLIDEGNIEEAERHDKKQQARLHEITHENDVLTKRLNAINVSGDSIQGGLLVYQEMRKAILQGLFQREYDVQLSAFQKAFAAFKSAYLNIGALTHELDLLPANASPDYFRDADRFLNTNHVKEYGEIIDALTAHYEQPEKQAA